MIPALLALIESKPAITGLIGIDPVRLYPRVLPQGLKVFPASTYRVVNNTDTKDFDGGSNFDYAYVDLFFYARHNNGGVSKADSLWWTFRKELENQTITHNGITIDDIFYMPSGGIDYLEDLQLDTKYLELKIAYYH